MAWDSKTQRSITFIGTLTGDHAGADSAVKGNGTICAETKGEKKHKSATEANARTAVPRFKRHRENVKNIRIWCFLGWEKVGEPNRLLI